MTIDKNKTYTATMKTNLGDIVIQLAEMQAPQTVNNFVFLAKDGFYDGVVFHRVVKGFMIQGGDPTGTGAGGPGYRFADELPKALDYTKGTIAMANAGPNTNGSQFFILTAPSYSGPYTNFGEVTQGMDVVDAIENTPTNTNTPTSTAPQSPQDHPLTDITITRIDLVKKK